MSDKPNVNPFQPSTSPWDQSFTSGGQAGSIVFPSGVAPNASPMVPIIRQQSFNVAGLNTPPALPSFWDATVIQLAMDGANGGVVWVDQKFGLTPTTHDGDTTDTSKFVFGGASTFCDGSTSSARGLHFADNPSFALGSKDFTIEGWFWANGADNLLRQYANLCTQSNNDTDAGSWAIRINYASQIDGLVYYQLWPGPVQLLGVTKCNDAKWHHVAVTRIGTIFSLYIDGVREATATSSIVITDLAQDLCFGGGQGFRVSLRGYLDEWRIVVGIGVYTGTNFLVPTAPFPTS